MSRLGELRARVRDGLTGAGLFAFSTVPEKAAPPMAYVGPGEPYLTPEGAAFGGHIARLQVVLVASAGVNDTRADELDAMVDTAVAALDDLPGEPLDYEVGRPGEIAINGQPYLGVAINVTTEIPRSAS